MAGSLAGTMVFGQVPDAGSLRQQIEREREVQLPRKLAPTAPAEPPALKALTGQTVTVTTFRFAGNTLLGAGQLAGVVSGYINRPIDFSQLQAAATAVERQALQEAVASGEKALATCRQEREEALQFWSEAETAREAAVEGNRQALAVAVAAGEQALTEARQAGEQALAATRTELEAAQQAGGELEALRTELGAAHQALTELEAARTELEAALAAARQLAEAQEQRALTVEETLQQHLAEGSLTEAQLDELHRQQEEVRTQHEQERLELMVALEEKETEAAGIVEVLSALELEKQALAAEVGAQRVRLQGLQALLEDLQEPLRRARDLARGQE